MSVIRNKQRLLHLYRYLMENTDEDHQITTNDLVQFLKQEDANASRKTVKDDIEVLVKEGIDIITTKSYYNSYFIGERTFEIPEITFLVDSIESNASLTEEKKQKIIEKLLRMLSKYQASKVRVSTAIRPNRGTGSEQLYYTVDRITEAISEGKKIEFQYMEYNISKEKVLCNDGDSVCLTPMVMMSGYDCYYMLGYDSEENGVCAYRVDRMLRTRMRNELGDPRAKEIDLDTLIDGLFGMQTGEATEVVLECTNDMMGTIIDRFGIDADTWKSTPDSFYVKKVVCLSPAFYAWVFGHAGKIRIVSPVGVVNEYMNMLRNNLRNEKRK